MAVNSENFDFDPEKLRQKYREERDKRLRVDGNDQYKEVKGDFSYFVEDPYIDVKTDRSFCQFLHLCKDLQQNRRNLL